MPYSSRSVYDKSITIALATVNGLSVFVGTPMNIYIISRLVHKDTKKSNYYRLLTFMCFVDIYQAIFGEVDFLADELDLYNAPKAIYYLLEINNEILWETYNLQSFFILIIVIHWKTVLKSSPLLDKAMYAFAIILFLLAELWDIGYQYIIYIVEIDRQTDEILEQILEYMQYVYFAFYSFILVFYLVSVRVVNTDSYSPVTLKAYKRMALVHFSQCSIIEILFIYHYGGDFVWQYFYYLAGKDRNQKNFLLDVYDVYQDIDIIIRFLLPCIRALFLSWALKGLLYAQKRERTGETTTSMSRRRTINAGGNRVTHGAQ